MELQYILQRIEGILQRMMQAKTLNDAKKTFMQRSRLR